MILNCNGDRKDSSQSVAIYQIGVVPERETLPYKSERILIKYRLESCVFMLTI